jgi:drug/metabolite transporter (DMT)-like permease
VKASIITGLGAFVSILIASYVFHYETMDRTKCIGGILGILGVVVMNWRPDGFGGGITMAGEGALLLSMISCAFSAGLIKRYSQTEDPVTLNGWQFIAGGAVMILLGLLLGGCLHPQGGRALLVFLYLACLSAAAYSLWAMLLKTCPISKIAVFMFLQPLFGVILGIVLVRQKMDIPPAQYLAALVLVCACIVVIQYRSEEKQT